MTSFYWGIKYIATCVELVLCCIFCGTFLAKEKISEKKGLILLLSMFGSFIFCFLNNVWSFSYLDSLLLTGVMLLFQKMIYRKDIILSLIFTLIFSSILIAIDFVSVSVLSLKMHVDTMYILNVQSIIKIKELFLSKIVLAWVIIAICKANKVKNYNFLQRYSTFMGISSVFAYVCNLIIMKEDLSNGLLRGILFLTVLALEFFIIYYGYKLSENHEQQQQIEALKMENEILQTSVNDTEHALQSWRTNIHDYKNHIIVLSQLSQNGKTDEIKDYLKEQNKLLDQNMLYIKTGNSTMDAIINAKKNIADQKNIVFYVNAAVSEECKINSFDIVSILGNLIDNALEACTLESKPYIDVSIKEENDFLIIKVINTFTGELPENMQTTKNNKIYHGIGMENIRNIVEKYNGEFEMVHKNNEVTTYVMLLNKEVE